MAHEIRPITPDELGLFVDCQGASFGYTPRPEMLDYRREIFEYDRSLAAFEDGEMVGTAGIFSFDLTVPGGVVPCACVTMVSVRPTHRRRGTLTAIMRRQLEDVRARGEAVAALWASESIIYGRFGYGLAAEGCHLVIDRTRTSLAHRVPGHGRLRMVEHEEARSSWPAVYDRVRVAQPGMLSRTEGWWNRNLRDLPEHREGYSGNFMVTYEERGEPAGYVRYRIKQDWGEFGLAQHEVRVGELMAETAAAYSALWEYVLNIDLAGPIVADNRRMDEPVYWMLADPRRLRRRPGDALWVRIIDTARALEARRYAAEGRVVFEVTDPFCPWVAGRFELEAGPGDPVCRPTSAPADISLGAAELGAAYLGSTRFATLRAAGRVQGSDDAIRLADRMFTWDPSPWCPEVF